MTAEELYSFLSEFPKEVREKMRVKVKDSAYGIDYNHVDATTSQDKKELVIWI